MYAPDFKTRNLQALDGAQALAFALVTRLGCGQAAGSHRCLLAVWQLYCCQGLSLAATAHALGLSTGSVYARLQKISQRLEVPVQDLRSRVAGTPGCSLAAEFRLRHKQLDAAENVAATELSVPTER